MPKITIAGKVVLLMLAGGIALGGYRGWQKFKPKELSASTSNTVKSGSQSTGLKPGETFGGTDTSTSDGVDIPFILTAAKKDWVGEQVENFNAQYSGKYKIVTKAIPSREAMHAILDGQAKPVLWSPGGSMWSNRLAEAYSAKNGAQILDMNDPSAYRVFLRSPLVFLTTKEKAKRLRPLLGTNNAWTNLRSLSLGNAKVPWGKFKWSHADPLGSSSGMMTLGLIMTDYQQRTGAGDALNKNQAFLDWLKQIETSMVYDKPAQDGTTKLTKAFIENLNRYDVITAYEGTALEAAAKNPRLAVIYPNQTSVSEHAVTMLSASWVSPQQKEGALAFIRFLGTKESIADGIKYKFRPASPSGSLSLSSELEKYAGQGFRSTYTTAELPTYEALNATAFQWKQRIANNK